MKSSFVTGLYGLGLAGSNYALPGTDPDADLTTWFGLINAGEPYDSNPLATDIVDEITTHHSSYYIDHSQPPAPLLIQNGWNDDLFPVEEAIRFYNRTRTQYPGDPISLYLMDDGHQRSQNKAADRDAFRAAPGRLVRPLPDGDRPGADVERRSADDQTAAAPLGRPLHGAQLERALRRARSASRAPRRRRSPPPRETRRSTRNSTRSAAEAPAKRRRAPIRPGQRTTGCAPAPAGGFTLLGSPTSSPTSPRPAASRRSPPASST